MRHATTLLLILAALAFGTYQEDTLFRDSGGLRVLSGRFTVRDKDTFAPLTLTHYPYSAVWLYALLDSVPGKMGPGVYVEWRWGTYDAYTKNLCYYGPWLQALPTVWDSWSPPYEQPIVVFDSLHCGPLMDPPVPLGWVSRFQFRVIGDTASDTTAICGLRIWARRRHMAEAGSQIFQWTFGPPKRPD